MKQPHYWWLLAMALLAAACEDSDDNTTTELSVICYNVAGLPQDLSSSDPELYSSVISPLLNDYDVVHLQEDFCYHDSILLHNTHTYRTTPLPCVPDGDGLNGLSYLPINNLERTAWEHCTGADCLTPKGFYYSQISLANGETIDFYNVHCNAGGGDPSLAARRGNIAQLCTYITEHSEGRPVIIMGDFNSRYTREGDTIRALLGMGFKDVWVELVRSGNVPMLGADRLDNCQPNRTNTGCERVDKLFYRSSDRLSIAPLSYQVDDERFYYQGNDTLPLSDHWPLIARFSFTRND